MLTLVVGMLESPTLVVGMLERPTLVVGMRDRLTHDWRTRFPGTNLPIGPLGYFPEGVGEDRQGLVEMIVGHD
ncbi:hypothetical protein Pan216_34850 [Planctomycetes bacterium Pan216]|uniref:Uncharacterized protein n=1 Tax=Kolteria novifilia TaxID=2527975 RepID=A0A518B6L8_9BACT|nr:hypothetical protein Pan216_34850 [Planctomycetes bacterium Pan216]